MGYDVFISYRRNGGEHTARMIRDRLSDLGYKVFFDVESLRSGNFNTKLYSVIDECSDFILVLSPNALDRCSDEKDWVRCEVEYALSKDKNIVPILLRDFKFDTELPETMKTLPQLNGIEASSEFFDAFINKLQKFLKAKPSFTKIVTQNSVVKKTVPLFIALVMIVGIVFGIKMVSDHFQGTYPRTKAEENLTKEVVYCVGMNLSCMEIIADSAADAIEAIERQLYVDSSDFSHLSNVLAVCRQSLNSIDESTGLPDTGLISRLSSTPFNAADITAMHDSVKSFKEEWLGNIDYLEFVASDSCYFPRETKVEILDCYKNYLEETLNMYACLTNMLFVEITNKNALEDLHSEILPGLIHIPLNSQNWCTDSEILKNKEKEYNNRLNTIFNDISVLTGNISAQIYTTEPSTQLTTTAVTTQATTVVQTENSDAYQKLIEMKNKIRETCLPEEGDSWDTLWIKMMHLLANDFYDDARDCADACRAIDTDPNAEKYMKSVDAFIDLIEREGLMYGCVVAGYVDPDNPHETIEIGDIIVSINGKPIKTSQEYTDSKSNITSEYFDVGVLRLNDKGEFKKITVKASKNSPKFYIYDLVNYYEE